VTGREIEHLISHAIMKLDIVQEGKNVLIDYQYRY